MVRKKLLALLFLLILIQPGLALGQAQDCLGLEIPIEVRLEGAPLFYGKDFQLILQAEDGSPLPQGADNNIYRMLIRGGSLSSFPRISFDSPGHYSYRIYQSCDEGDSIICDRRVYLITCYALSDDGDLFKVISYRQVGQPNKCEEIVFENTYDSSGVKDLMPISVTPEENPEDEIAEEDKEDKEDKDQPIEEEEEEVLPRTGENYDSLYLASMSLLLSYLFLRKKIKI